MLLLVLLLGSSIIFIFLNEGTSETYRCPYCAQIVVGQHHRLKCSLLNTRQSNVPVPSEVHPREYLQAANQGRSGTRKSETAPVGYKSRIVSFLHGVLGQRASENGATASLGRHPHVAH